MPFSGGRWGLRKRLEAFVEGFREQGRKNICKLFSPYIGLNLYNGALVILIQKLFCKEY